MASELTLEEAAAEARELEEDRREADLHDAGVFNRQLAELDDEEVTDTD